MEAASRLFCFTPETPPILVIRGAEDRLVPAHNRRPFCEKATMLGVTCTITTICGRSMGCGVKRRWIASKLSGALFFVDWARKLVVNSTPIMVFSDTLVGPEEFVIKTARLNLSRSHCHSMGGDAADTLQAPTIKADRGPGEAISAHWRGTLKRTWTGSRRACGTSPAGWLSVKFAPAAPLCCDRQRQTVRSPSPRSEPTATPPSCPINPRR